MAQNSVVGQCFSEEMRQEGATLTSSLSEVDVPVQASFWWRDPDADRWTLMIASSSVGEEGPRKVYRRIQSLLSRQSFEHLDLSSISVMSPSERLALGLKRAKRMGWDLNNRRLSNSRVGDVFVLDAYFYRVN